MRNVILILITGALITSQCYAGGGQISKSVEIKPKKVSSYQMRLREIKALEETNKNLQEYIEDLEEDNGRLRLAFYSTETVKTEPEVIVKEKKVEYIPWYYWLGLVVAIAI